ncbi:MAG TPA: hypothetical protein VH833_01495 [Gemmatimonadales bacterium]
MARDLRWWIAATLFACSVVGLVYLPPRGSSATRQRFLELEPPTPYRLRARALADQWRATSLQVDLMELRERIRPELARRRAADLPGVFLVFTGSDTVSKAARRFVAAQFDTIWSRLGLGATKVSVAVVLRLGPATARAGEPLESSESATAYLLPDSTDRSTCVVLLSGRNWPLATFAQPVAASNRRFTDWLESGLGPCAFYAAFGRPGREIGRWLGARRFDLALNPWWNRDLREGPHRPLYDALDARLNRWFLMEIYRFPPDAIACLGGREVRCRVAVLAGAGGAGAAPHLVTTEFWWRRQRLLAGDHYLADVAREIGRERFQTFWSSELTVDTALAAALRKPVGEWTAQWQGRLIPPIRLGPAAPPSAVWLGLLLAGLAVGLVTRTVSRREVR